MKREVSRTAAYLIRAIALGGATRSTGARPAGTHAAPTGKSRTTAQPQGK